MQKKKKIALALFICMMIAVASFSACGNQTVEPPTNNEGDSNSVKIEKKVEQICYSVSDKSLTIFDAEDGWTNNHLKADNVVVKEGRSASAKWDGIDSNQYFEIKCDVDFRKYEDLKVWVYSEKATNTEINI